MYCSIMNAYNDDFNSTIVRLKGIDFTMSTIDSWYFNSTIVRLKDATFSGSLTVNGFQFYDSTIKRYSIYIIDL